ncbi:MAG: hypothetical protein SGILL_004340 [Bacillariaceae sp.]
MMFLRIHQILFCVAATVALTRDNALLGMVSRVQAFSSTSNRHQHRSTATTSLKVSSAFGPDDHGAASNNGDNSNNQHENPRRQTEFTDLGSIEESMERQRRIQQEERNGERFVKFGDDLWALRQLMNKLSRKLLKAINVGLRDEEITIREQLRQAEQQDPEVVYKMEMEQLKSAKMEGLEQDAMRHSRNAYAARSCLPQFNLEGLWVGK